MKSSYLQSGRKKGWFSQEYLARDRFTVAIPKESASRGQATWYLVRLYAQHPGQFQLLFLCMLCNLLSRDMMPNCCRQEGGCEEARDGQGSGGRSRQCSAEAQGLYLCHNARTPTSLTSCY